MSLSSRAAGKRPVEASALNDIGNFGLWDLDLVTSDDQHFRLQVWHEETIASLKVELFENYGISPSIATIVWENKILRDHDVLLAVGLYDGSTLKLILHSQLGGIQREAQANYTNVKVTINIPTSHRSSADGTVHPRLWQREFTSSIPSKALTYHVKQQIEKQYKIPICHQDLWYNQQQMHNGRRICHYSGQPRNHHQVRFVFKYTGPELDAGAIEDAMLAGQIQILVRTLGGKTITIIIPADATVTGLKTLIAERGGLPEREQRLIYMGKQLEDSRTLLDYSIKKDATLHLVARLRGGTSTISTIKRGCYAHRLRR